VTDNVRYLPSVQSAGAPASQPAETACKFPGPPLEEHQQRASAQAPARARTREAPQARVQAAIRGIFSGSQAWETAPPSLAAIWSHHSASARYYSAALVRYPRYAFGWLHVAIAALVYLVAIATDSVWKIAGLAAVLALLFWLL
jgi:Flp pilus assembly protein TadB